MRGRPEIYTASDVVAYHRITRHTLTSDPHHQLQVLAVRNGNTDFILMFRYRYSTRLVARGCHRGCTIVTNDRRTSVLHPNFNVHTSIKMIHCSDANGRNYIPASEVRRAWSIIVSIHNSTDVRNKTEVSVVFTMYLIAEIWVAIQLPSKSGEEIQSIVYVQGHSE
jgi:hypothetical protein